MTDELTVDQRIAEARWLLTRRPVDPDAHIVWDAPPMPGTSAAIHEATAHSLLAIAQMMAADRRVVDAEVTEDEGCPSELLGRCDALPGVVGNYVHRCTADPGHDGLHECGCGRVWGNRDDD